MALIDKASLLMVPSVYEDGTLYNVLPSGNKAPDETGNHNGYDQTRADFTFSRGFNLTATRVNASGLIEKGRENLLLQSNQFDTTWGNSNTTETSGQADKDGGTDAWLLTKSAGNGYLIQSLTPAGVQTASIYAKAGDSDWIYLQAVGTSTASCYFDLVNGTTGDTGALIDKSIELIGNGWYRCSITYNQTLSNFRIYPAEANSLSASSGSVYIQSAQLEYGLAASSYLDSGATTATAGVLENTPRIDYSSGAGALLLEPQRTNLVTYSEAFDLNWLASGRPAVETNVIVSPEGVQNGSRLSYGSGNVLRYQDELTFTNGYTYSIFVKKDVGRYVTIYAAFFTTSVSIGFDLDEGTCQAGGVIEPYADGWYRISVSKSVVGDADKSGYFYLYSTANLGDLTSQAGNKLYVYGAQIEEGTHVSSYVPTYGSAATRGADDCEKQGIGDVVGINEMSFLIEATPLMESNASNPPIFLTLTNNDGQTNICYLQMKTNNEIRFDYYVGGVQQFRITSGVNVLEYGTKFKAAIAIKDNDCVLYVNGTQIGADTSGSTTNLFNQINCGTYVTDTYTGGSVQQLAIFNERLTNEELATLTTL